VNCAIFACVDVTAQKKYERQIEEHLTRINEYSVEIETQKWELQEANRRLEALARHDGLTDLLNHRSFQEELARDVKRVEREGGSLSIVLMDIDHFKKYNDSFGHPAGDALLKQFAKLLIDCSRESDLVARYGGEEFVAILSGTDTGGAKFVAERIRKAVESADWPNHPITASFGVATFNEILAAPADLIEAADKALYAAKAAGRNAVSHWADLPKAA
jgi:diguanylate cyclase (GGDEF)-like protein